MRIIAGLYRSRAIRAGKDLRVRPTSDKVKGALFNMLEPVEGTRVLDLFAGTGNLGIEALSRGAAHVTFVERHPASLELIRGNLASLDVAPKDLRVTVLAEDVLSACLRLRDGNRIFDIVTADPPYEPGALGRILAILRTAPILGPEGILAVEHGSKDLEMPADLPWPMIRQRFYGDTALTLFKNG